MSMKRGSSVKNQEQRAALAERAAALFYGQRMSYGKIAAQLGLTKDQAKSAVKAGLGMSPALARQTRVEA